MQTISRLSQWLVGLAALSLIASLFLPVWRIDLWAPQYPEGLSMQIWLDHLSGDVEVINGLNHYIGMAHIKESMFPEFGYLRYVMIAAVVVGLIVAFLRKRSSLLLAYWSLFLIGAVLAIYDFWRWGYQYGHNLDPKAPMQVPACRISHR